MSSQKRRGWTDVQWLHLNNFSILRELRSPCVVRLLTMSSYVIATALQTSSSPAENCTSLRVGGQDDFFWTYTEEPHRTRRLAIIKAHPEVRKRTQHPPGYFLAYGLTLSLGPQALRSRTPYEIPRPNRCPPPNPLRLPSPAHAVLLSLLSVNSLYCRRDRQPKSLPCHT